jgi:DNA-binding MarR family transcriptional regulator
MNYGFHQALKKHGLTEQQYNILKVLRGFRKEGPLSIGFLKERMLDKKSDVSRIVDKLFAKKLIIRQENPTDRRQKALDITNKG